MFKKSLLLLGLAASLSANAGMYQSDGYYEYKNANVTIPGITEGHWDYGIDALYLQNADSLMSNLGGAGPQFFRPNWSWGLKLDAAYHFSTGKDININWAYYTQDQNMIDTSGSVYAANQQFNERNRMSIVNVELGQQLDLGQDWMIRVHGGVQYAGLTSRTWTLASVMLDKVQNQMLGPRAGLNIAYAVWNSVSFYTNGALGALYASNDITSGPNGALGNGVAFSGSSVTSTTEVDYDIGFTFKRPVSQGNMLAKVGWTSYQYTAVTLNHLAWQGLIVGVKWVGNP